MATQTTSVGGLVPPGDGDYIDPETGMKVTADAGGAKAPPTTIPDVGVGLQPTGTHPAGYDPLADGKAADLTVYLTNKGYDPSRIDGIVAAMLQNAAANPTVGMGPVPGIQPGTATASQTTAPTPVAQQTMGGLLANGSGLAVGNTDVSTREVQDRELVEQHLQGLLSGDSTYIRNARLRGAELANSRGQFGSSFMAGAAERAAIEAGLPIATADAQAYRDMATQNLDALNNHSLANLSRATSLDLGLLDANTNISIANMDTATRVNLANLDALVRVNIANLDARTQTSIANLSSQTQMAMQRSQNELAAIMQSREMTHQTGLEQLRQAGNIDLAMIDADLRMALEKYAQDGRIDLQNLSHEQALQVNEEIARHAAEQLAQNNRYTRQQNHTSQALAAQKNYMDYLVAHIGSDLDANAVKSIQEKAWLSLVAEFDLINGSYPEFPPITPQRG